MSWTTPPTFVASDPLAAAELNILGADLLYLKGIGDGVSFSGTKVKRDSNQSIANATGTSIIFTDEVLDLGGWWSSGATITVPAGAVPAGFTTIALQAIASVRFAANGTGTRQIRILQNGAVVDDMSFSALSGETTMLSIVTFFAAAAGDTVELQVQQNSGGALNVQYNRLTVVRFAPVA
jgi:hypothetical protein